MSSYDPSEHLQQAWGTLQREWEETSAHWRDAMRDEFANSHWEEFAQSVPAFQHDLAALMEAIAEVEHSVP